MRLEQFDNAISVDILSDTDIIDRSIDLGIFFSTMIILQYKLILLFWNHFKSLPSPNTFSQKFEDMNSYIYNDVVNLLSKTQEIVQNKNYKLIAFLRDYNQAKCIMENNFSTLGYSLAIGKLLFLRGNKNRKSDNVKSLSIVSTQLVKFFTGLSNDAQVLIPGTDQSQLLNLNQDLATDLIRNIMIKEIPRKLIRNDINIAEKYGKRII